MTHMVVIYVQGLNGLAVTSVYWVLMYLTGLTALGAAIGAAGVVHPFRRGCSTDDYLSAVRAAYGHRMAQGAPRGR